MRIRLTALLLTAALAPASAFAQSAVVVHDDISGKEQYVDR